MQLHSSRTPQSRQNQPNQVNLQPSRTLQFALNGSQGWGTYQKGHVSGVEIKKGAKWMVEGVKELREMNQKFGIQGL